jgi:hypothetical protein
MAAAPKVRRVLLMLEVETAVPLPQLHKADLYWLTVDGPGISDGGDCKVLQASANVIRAPKAAPKKGGRRG